jgi:hypothetical protein
MQGGPERRARAFAGMAMDCTPAIMIIIPRPFVHAMADGGVGRMAPPVAVMGRAFFPRVLIQCVGLQDGATHHVDGRRGVQVCLHTVPECRPWLACHPQFTGETRGRFTFGDAAEQEHPCHRALTGRREHRTSQQGVVAVGAPAAVGGNMVLLPKQPPIAARTASGCAIPSGADGAPTRLARCCHLGAR